MNEREAYIALNMMERVGPVKVRALVEILGSASAIFDASAETLCKAQGIGPRLADLIAAQQDSIPWQREMERCEACGLRLVTPVDKEYPELLSEIHDPPLALYVRGVLESRDRHSVAVVGTRRPSHYGRSVAQRIAFALGKAGYVITSGLALGIDTAAHEGAVQAKARTVAVIGAGFEHLYPAENVVLADSIVDGGGAIVSEFPLDRAPDKTTFPMRNRIVSGMSKGVLVVEAGRRSGAVITAEQAMEQGRTVFAVPGRIDSPQAQGCHALLKDGAVLVDSVEDVLNELGSLLSASACRQEAKPAIAALSEEEESLLTLVREGTKDVDGLIRASALNPSRVGSVLMGLEMKRLVSMQPGRVVELVGA